MWIKSAQVYMVRIKVKHHRGIIFPILVGVVDEFMEALTDIAWLVENVSSKIPFHDNKKPCRHHVQWLKQISPRGVIAALHGLLKDLSRQKGLDVVDVETGDVRVKISLK